MRLRLPQLAAHLIRFAASAAVMLLVPALAPLAALGVFLAAFGLVHDVAHGALGLPRRANEAVLALAGLAIATTGHGLRIAHMRHHAHPLAPDDLEGVSATMPMWRATLVAPQLSIALHAHGYRHAPARARRWQLVEYAALATLIAAALLVAPAALRGYALFAVGMQLMAPLWAGHLPHRTPAWLTAAARRLAFTRSPTVMSLLHHELHHAHPKLPVADLHAAARYVRSAA